jgi:hypothetical protein
MIRLDRSTLRALPQRPVAGRSTRCTKGTVMRDALTRYLQLGSVRDMGWVTAHFGHR